MDDIDRISSLPDYLLADILSLLSTKDAVATSVLSWRWRHVFTWITRLNFDESPISHCTIHTHQTESSTTFVMFVDNILQACQSVKFTSFSLKFGKSEIEHLPWQPRHRKDCYPEFEPVRLNAWISFPLAHGIQELDLCIHVRKPTKLPLALYGCQTLEVLKLDMNHELEVPMSFCLPNLKVFHFGFVDFSDSDFVTRLLLSCRCLEDLALIGYCWRGSISINISAYSLRRLVIRIADTDDEQRTDFVLDTPNLEFLEYSDYFAFRYSLGDLKSLVEASADTQYMLSGTDNGPDPILGLLRSMSNARHLFLCRTLLSIWFYLEGYLFLSIMRLIALLFGSRLCSAASW